MHWWAQQHKKAWTIDVSHIIGTYGHPTWTSTEENSGGWSEHPLHGKEKPFHNIQPSEEHSPGGRHCHCQSLQSREDFMRANTDGSPQGANKARLDLAKKHLKKPDHFWKSILWMAEIKFNLHQNDEKKKVWRRLGTAHDPKHKTSSVKHGGAVWWHERAWLPVALGYWCSVMWQKKQDEFWYRDILSAQIQPNATKLIGRHFIVQMEMTQNIQQKQPRRF